MDTGDTRQDESVKGLCRWQLQLAKTQQGTGAKEDSERARADAKSGAVVSAQRNRRKLGVAMSGEAGSVA